jgi:hypothetical protein
MRAEAEKHTLCSERVRGDDGQTVVAPAALAVVHHVGGRGLAARSQRDHSAGNTVDGGYRGINARNYGTGALTITVNEDVTGDASDGILALSIGSQIAVTVGSTGSVTSTGVVPGAFAVEIEGGPGTLEWPAR